jgi:DNA replication protein DnaD
MIALLRPVAWLLYLALVLSALCAAGAQALGEAKLQQMTRTLDLTHDQRERLRPILLNEEHEVIKVRNDPTLTGQQKAQEEIEIRQFFEPKVDAWLSPPQLEKVKEMREQDVDEIRSRAKPDTKAPARR